MFEALTLAVFETALSWSVVFGKRDAFREAFHNFTLVEVAAMRSRFLVSTAIALGADASGR